MALGYYRRAVGTFDSRTEAERALNELKHSGFGMDRVSIIAQDADRKPDIAGVNVEDRDRVGNKADEGAATGAVTGGVLGGLTGLLIGLGTLAIPGVGPVMLAGEVATTLATTAAGGAIGAATGGLLGALVGLGIPEERAKVYNDRVSRGHYLVIIDGTEDEIVHAARILGSGGIQEWGVYNNPNATTTRTDVVDSKVNPTSSAYRSEGIVDNVSTNPTYRTEGIVDSAPEVIIIDRRDETR